MPVVKLFGGLRRPAGGNKQLVLPGKTAGALLEALGQAYPKVHDLLWEGSALRSHIRIFMNGHAIELAQGLDTPLAEDDELAIFPPIAGGCTGRPAEEMKR